jgi:hypothetical protein
VRLILNQDGAGSTPAAGITAHKGKDEEQMGKEAKIKAATKALRQGDTAEAMRHASKIEGRTFRRLTDRAMGRAKASLPGGLIEFRRG